MRDRNGDGSGGGARIRARLAGIALLARGRAEGLRAFPGTRRDAAISFVPLLSLPLATFAIDGGAGWHQRLADLLANCCALLAPPVLAHALAARFGRADRWPLYAAATNWCRWAMPVLALPLLLALSAGTAALAPATGAILWAGLAGLLVGYALWLHWFVARRALSLDARTAMLLVAVADLGGLAAVLAPWLLARLLTRGVSWQLDQLWRAPG